MRVAVLYDIHGNLPALEAVLQEIHQAGVDHVVVGGDVVPGPMSRETLDCLLRLDIPVRFIQGNGEVEVLAQRAGRTTLTRDFPTIKHPDGCLNGVWRAGYVFYRQSSSV